MNVCRLCAKGPLSALLDFGEHPIAHHFLTNPDKEEYVHPVKLYFCEKCGLIQLVDVIPEGMFYTQYFCLSSWKKQSHISRLIELVGGLPGFQKRDGILEVGSNDGIFLEALQERGYRKTLGVEPAIDAGEAARQKGIQTIGAYFNPQVARKIVAKHGKFKLFAARQTLEHVSDLALFAEAMRTALSPGGFVLIEVPDFTLNLSAPDYTIWEEHVNYFTPETIKSFLENAGVRVIHSERVVFSGEALVVIGEYKGKGSGVFPERGYLEKLKDQAMCYQQKWPLFRNTFIQYLKQQRKTNRKIALYGAGSRACSLINFTGLAPYLSFVVDDQPQKQAKFMPGSKLPILPSESLEKDSVSLCLLAVNAECEDRVIARHRSFQERGGSFVSVLPPSPRLAEFWSRL